MEDFFGFIIVIVIIISVVTRIAKAQKKDDKSSKTTGSSTASYTQKPSTTNPAAVKSVNSLDDFFQKIENAASEIADTKSTTQKITQKPIRKPVQYSNQSLLKKQTEQKTEISMDSYNFKSNLDKAEEAETFKSDSGGHLVSDHMKQKRSKSISTFETTTETTTEDEISNPLKALDKLPVYKRAIAISEIIGKPKGFF